MTSDTEQNSANEMEHPKDQRKKRVRKNIKIGELSSMEGEMDNHGASSEGEHSEEASKEVKKPRLGENNGTNEEDNNVEILKTGNTAEEKNINSEELSEGKMGDKDDTEGLKEEDNIMQVLLDMHEDVPLEDPGPKTPSEDREEGVAGLVGKT